MRNFHGEPSGNSYRHRPLVISALSSRFKHIGLGTAITLAVAIVVVPGLLLILIFGHQRHLTTSLEMLDEEIIKVQKTSLKMADLLIGPTAATLKLLAEVAAINPALFRTERSLELLFQALSSAPQIDAIYVSFEDGYHRVMTRIDSDRRRSDPRIPANANWHTSYLLAFQEDAQATPRIRYRSFYDRWPNLVGRHETKQVLDTRSLRHYQLAKSTGRLVVDQPTINPDTGSPVVSLGFPIYQDGKYAGFVGANITLKALSEFLAVNQVSKNSLAIIADAKDKIIVHPDPRKGVVKVGDGPGDVVFASLVENADARIQDSTRHHLLTGKTSFHFTTSQGEELSASFLDFLPDVSTSWQLVVLTPIDDFIGPLRVTNRAMAFLISSLLAFELFLIYFLGRRLARGVEDVTRRLGLIQTLSFAPEPRERRASRIKEIADLEAGVILLQNALQTFSQYVPRGLVRQLVESRRPLSLGVDKKMVTILFSDIEDFSVLAESMDSEELLEQISEYFSALTGAIVQEHGTVDKFIGDAVMAFWGAPLPREDHALRACAGALRAMRNMDRLNQTWNQQGRVSLKMRIGLNTANVLIGNVGSSERLSYTAMGDGVNIASRLEGKNKEFGSKICISDSVYHEVADKVVARPLGSVVVKGRRSEFPVYELLALKDSDDPLLMPSASDFDKVHFAERAAMALSCGDREAARLIYQESVARFPDDAVARILLKRCSDE